MLESIVETASEMRSHSLLVNNAQQSSRIFHPASVHLYIQTLDNLKEYIVGWET